MRHSKSVPEGATKKLSHKWPSVNTDSGISLMSSDTFGRSRDGTFQGDSRSYYMTTPSTSSAIYPEQKSKRLPAPPPPPVHQPTPNLPPLPAKPQQIQGPPVVAGSLPRPSQVSSSFTVVVYSFCDEEVPYRIKIPGTSPPTLRQFKEFLPKKGNYRLVYFLYRISIQYRIIVITIFQVFLQNSLRRTGHVNMSRRDNHRYRSASIV